MLRKFFVSSASQFKGVFLSQAAMSECGPVKLKNITYEKIQELLKARAVYIIDVRKKNEIEETGAIPTSLNIPLDEIEDALKLSYQEFANKYQRDKPGPHTKIAFSCRSGVRSKKATGIALQLGYTDPNNYAGGWIDWDAHQRALAEANKSE